MMTAQAKGRLGSAPKAAEEALDFVSLVIEVRESSPGSIGGRIIKRWEIRGERDNIIDMVQLMTESLPTDVIICAWMGPNLVFYHTGKVHKEVSPLIRGWRK